MSGYLYIDDHLYKRQRLMSIGDACGLRFPVIYNQQQSNGLGVNYS